MIAWWSLLLRGFFPLFFWAVGGGCVGWQARLLHLSFQLGLKKYVGGYLLGLGLSYVDCTFKARCLVECVGHRLDNLRMQYAYWL